MYLGPMPGGGESGCGAHAAPRQHGRPCTPRDADVGQLVDRTCAGSCCARRHISGCLQTTHLLQELSQVHSMRKSLQNHAKPT